MNRGSFLKSLLGILIAPKSVVGIAKTLQLNQGCVFDVVRIEKRLDELKMQELLNRKPPQGYSIKYESLRNKRWQENYRWAMGKTKIGQFNYD